LFICKTLKTLLLPAVTSTAGRVDNTAGVGSGEVLSDVTDCVTVCGAEHGGVPMWRRRAGDREMLHCCGGSVRACVWAAGVVVCDCVRVAAGRAGGRRGFSRPTHDIDECQFSLCCRLPTRPLLLLLQLMMAGQLLMHVICPWRLVTAASPTRL